MPNIHGQTTERDFRAPEGKSRIMKEDMEDGALEIVADFYHIPTARKITNFLQADDQEAVFTLWDDQGNEVFLL